jgi:hypothetical protein
VSAPSEPSRGQRSSPPALASVPIQPPSLQAFSHRRGPCPSVLRPLENASHPAHTGLKFQMRRRAVPFNSVFVPAARHKNSSSLGRRSDRACRADRDLRAAVGLAGRHLHAARRADGRRRPHVRIVGAARLVALMLFLAGIAINLVLGCWPPRISCKS